MLFAVPGESKLKKAAFGVGGYGPQQFEEMQRYIQNLPPLGRTT